MIKKERRKKKFINLVNYREIIKKIAQNRLRARYKQNQCLEPREDDSVALARLWFSSLSIPFVILSKDYKL